MSIMVCKKCGHQVDTDFHAEQMNDLGLCDACASEEFDTVCNSAIGMAAWMFNAEPEAIADADK